MRLFLAVNLQPRVRQAIVDATAPLRAAAPSLSWMDEARLHLTLKFLGDQDDTAPARLSPALDDVAARHAQFSVQIGEIGAFPNFRRARVVWMGIERSPRLELLHHDVEVACDSLGFPLDGRPFRPHLTLARVRDTTEESERRSLSRAAKRLTFQEETTVESVDVMRSHLGGSAPAKYERLHAATLRDGSAR